MNNYLEKFEKCVDKYFVKGQQNNKILAIVRFAKYFELDKPEALSFIRSKWVGNFEKADEKSFDRAWGNGDSTPDETYSEQLQKRKNNEESEVSIIDDKEFNTNFKNILKSFDVQKFIEDKGLKEKTTFEDKDTSILNWWFKESDWVYIVNDKFDSCEQAYDAKELFERQTVLKRFQFMSMSAFKDCDGKRNQKNLKEMRYILLESDEMPIEWQEKFFFSLIEFGIPVKSIIRSGGKSLHCLIKIHPMRDINEYTSYCMEIFNEFNKLHPRLIDTANKDGIRYTRSPFGYRSDKNQVQEVIYCDKQSADAEIYTFNDTLELVREYVKTYNIEYKDEFALAGVKYNVESISGRKQFDVFTSIDPNKSDIEDIFQNNASYWVKRKQFIDIQRCCKKDIMNELQTSVKDVVGKHLLQQKIDELGEKPSKNDVEKFAKWQAKYFKTVKNFKLSEDDFIFKNKEIKYDMTLTNDEDVFNLYKPGFYIECLEMIVKELPSESAKLLDNLADEKCKKWLINHFSCYFQLLKNGFNHPLRGQDHVLETVPVFYGKSGTGKNTLIDVIGRAISANGAVDITISQLTDNFNEFYRNGVININEAAKGRSERRASREALKAFTDRYKNLNRKFMPNVRLFNGAYKTICANESDFGVLDIDNFDRRFQYITGGKQLDGKKHNVIDMKKFREQEKEFIAYLLNYECDWDLAETVFDNDAKLEDKMNSMSNPEKVAYWLWENVEDYDVKQFSTRTGLQLYNNINGTRLELDPRVFGKCLSKYFPEKCQWAKKAVNENELQRGEYVYKVESKVKSSTDLNEI